MWRFSWNFHIGNIVHLLLIQERIATDTCCDVRFSLSPLDTFGAIVDGQWHCALNNENVWKGRCVSLNPSSPKSDQLQISPCNLARNITSNSTKNVAFHSLLRWKMIILPILTNITYTFLVKSWENVRFELGSARVNLYEQEDWVPFYAQLRVEAS